MARPLFASSLWSPVEKVLTWNSEPTNNWRASSAVAVAGVPALPAASVSVTL